MASSTPSILSGVTSALAVEGFVLAADAVSDYPDPDAEGLSLVADAVRRGAAGEDRSLVAGEDRYAASHAPSTHAYTNHTCSSAGCCPMSASFYGGHRSVSCNSHAACGENNPGVHSR
ncbi:MAG: hypothetical protein Q8P40_06705 [Nitrospirota bacterium]|nr:hypothetical protein [Nitrospirota bacterium]